MNNREDVDVHLGANAVDAHDKRRAERPDWFEELSRMMTQSIESAINARLEADLETLRHRIVQDMLLKMVGSEVDALIHRTIKERMYVYVSVKAN